jgi:hypothetical protein
MFLVQSGAGFQERHSIMQVIKTRNVILVAPTDLSQALGCNKSCNGVCRKKVKTVEMDIMVRSDGL